MARRDDYTAPLIPVELEPAGAGSSCRRQSVERRRNPFGAGDLSEHAMPWGVYEFATPEAALLYVGYVLALGRVRGWWPGLDVERDRVRLDLRPVALEGGVECVRTSAAALHAAALDLGARPGVARGGRGGDLRDEEGA